MTGPQKVRILVADDDVDFRQLCGDVLREAGYEVTAAADGAEALATLRRDPHDVVLSDLHMPHLSGLDFLKELRAKGLDIPVVLITGDPCLQAAAEAVELGAYRYLTKPFDTERLLTTVAAAFATHRVARSRRPSVHASLCDADRRSLEKRFQDALQMLHVTYQAIVLPGEKRVFGYEASVGSAELTLRIGTELFEAAWRLGLVHDLGRAFRKRVAEEAIAAPPTVTLFLEVHAEELMSPELWAPSSPLAAVASRTVLQIAHRACVQGVGQLEDRLDELRKLGFRIAVKGLGAYVAEPNSLAWVRPAFVHLDRALVDTLETSTPSRSLVDRVFRLYGSAARPELIAAGVETDVHLEAVQSKGCSLVQGDRFSRRQVGFHDPWAGSQREPGGNQRPAVGHDYGAH